MSGFDERVEEKMRGFAPYVDRLSGARGRLLEDSLRDYCHVAVQLEDVNAAVLETGTTIRNRAGNPVKNPDLTVQHSLRCEKNALLPKLMKYLPDEDSEDALAAFMGA